MEEIAIGKSSIKKEVQLEDIFTKEEIEQRKNQIRERAIRDYYSDMKTSRDEGLQEGRQEARREVIQLLIQAGYTTGKLAELLDMTEDEVKSILKSKKNI